jgi:transposase
MSKLTYEDKIEIYNKRKSGLTKISLAKEYNVSISIIDYLYRLIDKHSYDILRTSKNKYYPPYQKKEIINRVLLNGETITSVAIDEGLPSFGMLPNWIKKYKENGYNIVERKRGRPTMSKVTKKKGNETDKDNKNKEIIDKIKEIFINNKERYGYRRITLELRNQGYNVNHKKVYRIMAKLG